MKNAFSYITIAVIFMVGIIVFFPFGAHIDGDTGYYFSMAVQAANNGIFEIRETLAPMGYPLLLNVARYFFIGDFLKGALIINAICFLLVLFFVARESTETVKDYFSPLEQIYTIMLLFLVLFKQYFDSRILFSAWAETPFIAFTAGGLYFMSRIRKDRHYYNFMAFWALTFFVAAWYCKFVGVVGIAVFFLYLGLLMFQFKPSIGTVMLRIAALFGILFVFVAPAVINNYIRTGHVLGVMANPQRTQSIFIKLKLLDNYLNRVVEFFNDIFAHLLSSFYLIKYPDLLIGILALLSAVAFYWVFRTDFQPDKNSKGLIGKLFNIKHIEWYIWGAAYTGAMMLKLLAFNFSTQAMSRYASPLIPVVSIFIIDFIGKFRPMGRRLFFPMIITLFTVLCVVSMSVNLPDYSQSPKKVAINNSYNLRGYPQFRQIQEMLNKVESVYFLPRRKNWPIADKFYALFPCKEFYVSRDWSAEYFEKIYPIPKLKTPYAVISDYEAEKVLPFIDGKGEIVEETIVLGFSIYLVEPYAIYLQPPLPSGTDRNRYLGHGFISHGCR